MALDDTLMRPRPLGSGAARWHAPGRRVIARLLRLPLFQKVLVANCVLVLLGVVLGTWYTLSFVTNDVGQVRWTAMALMLLVAFGGTVLINWAVLSLAMQPLSVLERTVDRVAAGDLHARTQPVVFSDPEIERLSETLNGMLDVVQEHHVQVQKLSEQVLAAQEDERKRIARELHDETAQSLTTLLIRLKILERARTEAELREQMQELRELTVSTLETVRKLAVELRPSTLDDLGLVAALEAYADGYAARIPIQVRFVAEGLGRDERLASQVELVLYRVVQEALTNVAKHARADTACVLLRRSADGILAQVDDDGTGFDVSQAMRSRERGLGLFGMQERLALVQGTLSLESTAGRGTRVRAWVPAAESVVTEAPR